MDSVTARAVSRCFITEPDNDPVHTLDESRYPVLGNAILAHDFWTGVTGGTGVGDILRRGRRALHLRRDDAVFPMAVDTQRRIRVSGKGLETVNASLIFLINKLMTAAAGLRLFSHEMGFSNALDVVDAMAIRADSRKPEKAFFKESFSMDALSVLLVGHLPVDVVLDDNVLVLVTSRASQRNIRSEDRRFRVIAPPDIVLPVAVPASSHLLDSPLEVSPAMDAIAIEERVKTLASLPIFPVANPRAVDIRDVLGMGDHRTGCGGDDLMTACAFQMAMHRGGIIFFIDPVFFVDCGVKPVAGQTVLANWGALRLKRKERHSQEYQHPWAVDEPKTKE